MNKKLIAVAIAGACTAPAAMAQTAGPVTLYGRVYLTAVSVEAKANTTSGSPEIARKSRIDDQSSLLGVRGTEDIGGGMKAFFQLETGFNATQAPTCNTAQAASGTFGCGTGFAGRNSGVGVQSGWGSVLAGRWDTPYKVSTYPIDAFGDLTMAAISGLGHDQGNFDRRDQNQIEYWSPDWAGFAFKLMWQTNFLKTATTNPYDQGANVTYTKGPLYLMYAYEEHKDPSPSYKKESGNSLGGTFSFGPIKIGAEYEQIRRTAVSGQDPKDRKELLANIIWTVGNNQFIYQYQDSKDGGANTSGAVQPECNSNTLAYKYVFTKRTFFIAQYMKTDNKNAGTCSFGTTATYPVKAGNDVDAFDIGLQHVF